MDFIGRVAWAQAALIAGYRDEAVEQIQTAYGLRNLADWEAFDLLIELHQNVGLRDRAVSLSRTFANSMGTGATDSLIANCALVALWAGDITYLHDLVAFEERGSRQIAWHFLTARFESCR